jgi:hypothetical protein
MQNEKRRKRTDAFGQIEKGEDGALLLEQRGDYFLKEKGSQRLRASCRFSNILNFTPELHFRKEKLIS